MPVAERNAVTNLLYLCPTCHDIIDKNNGEAYPVRSLRQIKATHETWTTAMRRCQA